MYQGKRVAVIIAAAGQGSRLGSALPKQYLKIGGQPVLVKAMKAFEEMEEIDHIFVVAGEDHLQRCRDLIGEHRFRKVDAVVAGGARRQDSVYNALQELNRRRPGVEYVLIHDAARPFISREVIDGVLQEAAASGAAVACVAMKNSVRRKADGAGSESVDRSEYYSVQTPQGFRKSLLLHAYEQAYDDNFFGTDDAAVVEHAGGTVAIVDGAYQNIKITTKEDLPMENRVGTGFDVHQLTEGRKLILGGVEIPYEKGLAGHSDADVLTHAVMDALLGAAALRDIGYHFPDTDMRYKGADSRVLLRAVREKLEARGYRVGNVDVTMIAQSPKLKPHIPTMIANIAADLGVGEDRVNVKATTEEQLGFTGTGEGMACHAVCILE